MPASFVMFSIHFATVAVATKACLSSSPISAKNGVWSALKDAVQSFVCAMNSSNVHTGHISLSRLKPSFDVFAYAYLGRGSPVSLP